MNKQITSEFTSELIEQLSKNQERPKTRSSISGNIVLEYAYGTKTQFKGSSYFHSLLLRPDSLTDSDKIGNFVLNLVLPLPAVGSLVEASRERFSKRRLLKIFGETASSIEEVTAGSSSEGLGLPQTTHIRGNNFKTELPDQDKKFIFHGLVVSKKKGRSFAYLENAVRSPPAFIRLKFNSDFIEKENLLILRNPKLFLTEGGYVDRIKFVSYLRTVLKDEQESHSIKCKDGIIPTVTFSIHGPAFTAEVEDEQLRNVFSTDNVICLPCPVWPEQAREWKTRSRVWPDKGIVNKVVREGCYIVPKGYKKSETNREEFCFSFSICDITLSKSLSLNQRRCYMLFKFIFKHHINKVTKGLTSFYCKVTFFWLCEQRPATEWTDENLLDSLVALLGQLKEFISAHVLPHYYIPQYNLIADLSERSMKACLHDVDTALKQPWQIVLTLTENHRFRWLSRDISLIRILHNLKTDVIQQIFQVGPSLLTFLSEMLDKGEGLFVLSIVCKDWLWSSNVSVETHFHIRHLEEMISYLDGSGNLVCLNGLLANLYHQLGVESGNIAYLIKSGDIFTKILDDIGPHTWIYACFYDLLFYLEDFEKIVKHFVTNLMSETVYTSGIYTTSASYNKLTFGLAQFTEFMVFPSTAYIFFRLIYAYEALSQTAKTQYKQWLYRKEGLKVLEHLSKWVSRKCKLYPELFDDILNYLVGSCAEIVGNERCAVTSYTEAISYGLSFLSIEIDEEVGNIPVVASYKRRIFKRNSSRWSVRVQPYRKVKERRLNGLPPGLTFRGGIPRVGEYIHF